MDASRDVLWSGAWFPYAFTANAHFHRLSMTMSARLL